MDIERGIRVAVDTGKVILGSNKTIQAIKLGKGELVVLENDENLSNVLTCFNKIVLNTIEGEILDVLIDSFGSLIGIGLEYLFRSNKIE